MQNFIGLNSLGVECRHRRINARVWSFLSARCIHWPGFALNSFLSLRHRRRVAGLSVLYKVDANCNHSELSTASSRVRQTRAPAVAHPLEFEVSRCRSFQFARGFLMAQVRMWDDLSYTVFDAGTLDGFKQTNKQTNNNDLLEKRWRYKELHMQGLIVWHSRSRQCVLTAIKTLH